MIPHLAGLVIPADAFGDADDNAQDHTGKYAWPAGDRLARDLPDLVAIAGRRICDIGCGRGHLGLSALRLGAAQVTFCDGHEAICAGVRAVLAANGLHAQVFAHDWGTATPGGPYDVVVGGDILYRSSHFPALFDSLASAIDRDGEILLSDPRLRLESELPDLAAARGLTWATQRQRDYTLVRMRRG
jgi:2-polyprenyl-3-methyl-5-hydroxy-6-metoxy-1,4-benzoquinol methylase